MHPGASGALTPSEPQSYNAPMPTPFPGMDPYLEHPDLWPDVHNRLITAISDHLSPGLAPRYYVALERRTYFLEPDDLEVVFVGRPDVSVIGTSPPASARPASQTGRDVAVLDVEVPLLDEVGESFLEVRQAGSHQVVTVLELLSPANKLHRRGRADYEAKRLNIFQSRTSLVEIDLLRSGDPMPLVREPPRSHYRILVSRGERRPRAQLHRFSVRDPIPKFQLPLLQGDVEPEVDLGAILHALYERARFDLRLDYSQPCVPPLSDEDASWGKGLCTA